MVIFPESGDIRVDSILMVVVFPAPLGPKKPNISLSSILKEMFSTAVISPNFLVMFSTVIIE